MGLDKQLHNIHLALGITCSSGSTSLKNPTISPALLPTMQRRIVNNPMQATIVNTATTTLCHSFEQTIKQRNPVEHSIKQKTLLNIQVKQKDSWKLGYVWILSRQGATWFVICGRREFLHRWTKWGAALRSNWIVKCRGCIALTTKCVKELRWSEMGGSWNRSGGELNNPNSNMIF